MEISNRFQSLQEHFTPWFQRCQANKKVNTLWQQIIT